MRTNKNAMTQEKWSKLTPAEKDAVRDLSGLSDSLIGLEGFRVEAIDFNCTEPHRFIVGWSTGWRPCHIELARRDSISGTAACTKHVSVKVLYKAN